MPTLIVSQLTCSYDLLDAWVSGHHDMLASSNVCASIKGILEDKLRNRTGTWFFGEVFTANACPHESGFYGSFKWLTNPRFIDGRPFPAGDTQKYQVAVRDALWDHFGRDQLKQLQETTKRFVAVHGRELKGKDPVPPDLWLIDGECHRFIESKLPGDWIKPHQLAGLALIGSCLQSSRKLSIEIVEVSPAIDERFRRWCDEIRC